MCVVGGREGEAERWPWALDLLSLTSGLDENAFVDLRDQIFEQKALCGNLWYQILFQAP